MICPKCKVGMYKVHVEGFEVDRCSGCEGLWFELREQEHLKDVAGVAEELDCADPMRGKLYNLLRNYPCPACGGPMVKMVIPEQPHIQIEQCGVCHGAFFDAGEFTDYSEFTLGERVKLFFSTFRKRSETRKGK